MTRRRLTAEEIALWQKVVARAERLHPESAPVAQPLPKPKPTKPAVARPRPAPRPEPPKPDPVPAPPPTLQMDHKQFGRMKRGKLMPEGRIDLHGMTLDQAHPELTGFILSAHAAGKRLVLVITGKGKSGDDTGPIPRPRGILRRQVPQWLAMPPLAQAVLQVTPAHLRHGGEGAFYVYLRRGR